MADPAEWIAVRFVDEGNGLVLSVLGEFDSLLAASTYRDERWEQYRDDGVRVVRVVL